MPIIPVKAIISLIGFLIGVPIMSKIVQNVIGSISTLFSRIKRISALA